MPTLKFGGGWTEQKLRVLDDYLAAYCKIFQTNPRAKHFDTIIISAEVGMSKPDPQIFQLFAQQLGVETTELIFIDDSENSLISAKEVGYTPILYTGYEELEEQLQNLGII